MRTRCLWRVSTVRISWSVHGKVSYFTFCRLSGFRLLNFQVGYVMMCDTCRQRNHKCTNTMTKSICCRRLFLRFYSIAARLQRCRERGQCRFIFVKDCAYSSLKCVVSTYLLYWRIETSANFPLRIHGFWHEMHSSPKKFAHIMWAIKYTCVLECKANIS